MKVKASEPARLEAPPNVKQLVSTKLDSVFTAGSQPTHVRVSAPLHDPRGTGWTACVRAELTSVIGKPLGTQTYRVVINDGVILDRRLVEADDNCLTETYEADLGERSAAAWRSLTASSPHERSDMPDRR